MTQKPIPLQPNRYYHIYNRGNNGENIFIEERNYAHFLNLYDKHISPVADTFAYRLLRNHFHLLVRIKDPSGRAIDPSGLSDPTGLVSRHFSNFFNAYAKAINRAYQRTGSLFETPFRRIEVTSERYFVRLTHYIHWNPQKHGFVDDFRDYRYSSYHALLSDRPTHLRRDEVLDWFHGRVEFTALHDTLTDEKEIAELIGDNE
jgi:hypothetical protein